MSNEIRNTALMEFQMGDVTAQFYSGIQYGDVAAENPIQEGSLKVNDTAVAIPLGPVTLPGYFIIQNTDQSNNVFLMSQVTGGIDMLILFPKQIAMGYFAQDAPAVRCDTSLNAIIKYLIVQR